MFGVGYQLEVPQVVMFSGIMNATRYTDILGAGLVRAGGEGRGPRAESLLTAG